MHEFFTYLPLSRETLVWGAAVTSAGLVRTEPDCSYPPARAKHPPDHVFTWEKGRTLRTWQLLLIKEGQGWFESDPTGRKRLLPGTVFFIFPGVWHRYAPDQSTGWLESWIELEGPVLEDLLQARLLDPRRAVFALGPQPEVAEAFDQCHRLALSTRASDVGQLATQALQLVALVLALGAPKTGPAKQIETVVQKARELLLYQCEQPLQIAQLSKQLGVSESHFRRAFKARTGLSPKRYWMELRLRRVRALLDNSTLTVAQIAERMGYNSAYHLSAEFKKQTGRAPLHWRNRRD